jgi:hypothetical protein
VQMSTFMYYSTCWRSKEFLASTSHVTHLTFRQNRVLIVCSVIAKILNLASVGRSQLNFFLMTLFVNQCLLLFVASYIVRLYSVLLFESVFSIDAMLLYEFDSLFSICIIR